MATLAIDFDEVIHNPFDKKSGYKMGAPMLGAVEAMQQLAQTHRLIIHTIWADNPQKTKAIADWLDYFNIPFNSITNKKPDADLYIDNKALHFVSWDQTLSAIKERL